MKIALIDHYDSFTYNVRDWLSAGAERYGFDDIVVIPHDSLPPAGPLSANPSNVKPASHQQNPNSLSPPANLPEAGPSISDLPNSRQPFLEFLREQSIEALVFGPGPGRPEEYLASLQCLQEALGVVPILGICLGHQMIGVLSGAELTTSEEVFHGATRKVTWTPFFSSMIGCLSGEFLEPANNRFSQPMNATVYNSLSIQNDFFNKDKFTPSHLQSRFSSEGWELGNLSLELAATCEKGDVQAVVCRDQRGVVAMGLQFHPEAHRSEPCWYVFDAWLALSQAR